MNKSQLELALRSAGKIARDPEFFVFGSQSILGILARPPQACLVSQELDLYPRNHPQAITLLIAKLGARSAFARKHGFFVDCVTPDLAAFPDGWTERLIPFRTKRTGGVTGWCVELHDVVASKLSAGREKDLTYVRTLLGARLIKPVIVEDRISTLPLPALQREELFTLLKELAAQARSKRKPSRGKK